MILSEFLKNVHMIDYLLFNVENIILLPSSVIYLMRPLNYYFEIYDTYSYLSTVTWESMSTILVRHCIITIDQYHYYMQFLKYLKN